MDYSQLAVDADRTVPSATNAQAGMDQRLLDMDRASKAAVVQSHPQQAASNATAAATAEVGGTAASGRQAAVGEATQHAEASPNSMSLCQQADSTLDCPLDTHAPQPSTTSESAAASQEAVSLPQTAAAAGCLVTPPSARVTTGAESLPVQGTAAPGKATQSAAEMLQWLDAALAAKKQGPTKVSTSHSNKLKQVAQCQLS